MDFKKWNNVQYKEMKQMEEMEKCLNKMDEIQENELEMNEMKVTVKFR